MEYPDFFFVSIKHKMVIQLSEKLEFNKAVYKKYSLHFIFHNG